MILDKSIFDTKPKWSDDENNRWADYIELSCMENKIITPADLGDLMRDDDLDNYQERGGLDHSENADIQEEHIKDYFRILQYRKKLCEDYYPFEVDEDYAVKFIDELTDKQQIYVFLLMCSSISYMNKSAMHFYTLGFEKFCKIIMSQLVPIGSEVKLFGTSRENDLFRGDLRNRIEVLASVLHAYTTKTFDGDPEYDGIPGGDNGLDIISYLPIDEAQVIPFAFGQCTCSYEKWIDKQDSIEMSKWSKIMEPLVPYPTYMFVPFSCHTVGGRLEKASRLKTILIDRIRILRVIVFSTDIKFQEGLKEAHKEIINIQRSLMQDDITNIIDGIINEINSNPQVTQLQIAEKMAVSIGKIQKVMDILKESGRIMRVGSRRYGSWQVIE